MISALAYTRLASVILAGFAVLCINAVAAAFEYNGPKITFEQVFENPDDNELKLNYARQQAASGDLLGAAGALEGMLYSQPNWDSARLFYAIVLYELDDRQSAMREFKLLDGRPLTSEQRALVARYQEGVSTPSTESVKVSGVLEIGVRTDNNAGNALFDSFAAFADASDTSAFANGALQLSVPITKSGDLALSLQARGQTRKHSTFSSSDYDVLGASAGIAGETSGLFYEAGFDFDNVSIGGEKYLTQMGPKLSISKMVSDKTQLSLTGAGYYQDFEELSFSSGERFRSGHKYIVSADISTRVNVNLNYGLSAGFESKNATQNALAYDGFNISGDVFKGFDSGLYVKGKARYRDLNYDALNLMTPMPTDRSDSQISGRVGLGASVNKIGTWLGAAPNPSLSRIYVESGLNYTDYNSNISIFEYENFGAELKLIWDF